MSTEVTARAFFSSKFFAVVGASSNPAKFGHKIFAWYLHHNIPATPINPTSNTVNAAGKDHPAVPNLAALPNPKETSVSIITPPAATLKVLHEAKELGIPAVWLQPGTFDDAVLEYARGEGGFEAVVAGFGGGTVGGEGWCVLVDGERAMKSAGKL
ncbi:hypothetical protein K4K53_003354 [Colletotrichum sp. SAR 10_77]|nr:hypothetical protein K4K52_008729 [Colletotrichum sp. SAR 10_76]KAI8243790.1 hypothetical protein K4K53_003354 [Colletotrichum sp. SAR 10_77]